MTGESLPSVQDPLATLAGYGFGLPSNAFTIFFAFLFLLWLIYTLILAYHWFRYSHAPLVALPALFTHVVISFACMVLALSGSVV
jgi:hypothetical protein